MWNEIEIALEMLEDRRYTIFTACWRDEGEKDRDERKLSNGRVMKRVNAENWLKRVR